MRGAPAAAARVAEADFDGLLYMADRIQKCMIHLNPVKSLLQHHQTRMTPLPGSQLQSCVL
jgi:hypothetical protein